MGACKFNDGMVLQVQAPMAMHGMDGMSPYGSSNMLMSSSRKYHGTVQICISAFYTDCSQAATTVLSVLVLCHLALGVAAWQCGNASPKQWPVVQYKVTVHDGLLGSVNPVDYVHCTVQKSPLLIRLQAPH